MRAAWTGAAETSPSGESLREELAAQASALLLLLLGAGGAGVAFLVRGLEALVALIEGDPPDARHALAAEIADEPGRARDRRALGGVRHGGRSLTDSEAKLRRRLGPERPVQRGQH